jgi:hypothetical protein
VIALFNSKARVGKTTLVYNLATTAFRWWKAGRLDAYQLDTGTAELCESPHNHKKLWELLFMPECLQENRKTIKARQVQRRIGLCERERIPDTFSRARSSIWFK